MSQLAQIFEKTFQDYLQQTLQLDLPAIAAALDLEQTGKGVRIVLFGQPYSVSSDGIADARGRRPSHAICVVLFKYLLMCPGQTPVGADWAPYRSFPDAAPFAGAFVTHTEAPIARNFSGRLTELRAACQALGGSDPGLDWPHQLCMRFNALTRVPLLLLFNDKDDEFPADCRLMFEQRAEHFLDMECLAMVGWQLSDYLAGELGIDQESLM